MGEPIGWVDGYRLRAIREAAALTQIELSRRSGVSQSNISGMERGRLRLPSYRSVRKLATALDVPVQDLLAVPDATPAPAPDVPTGPHDPVIERLDRLADRLSTTARLLERVAVAVERLNDHLGVGARQ